MNLFLIFLLLLLAGATSGVLFHKYWPNAPFVAVVVVGMVLTTAVFKIFGK